MTFREIVAFASLFGIALAAAPAQAHDQTWVWPSGAPNFKPRFLGPIAKRCFDASQTPIVDDLLTAGLGKTGLAGAAPEFANPLAPTAAELRKRAIHTNYRAVLDITATGGYGTLYGPNVDKDGNVTTSEGYIFGCEYIAFADDGSGRKNVTLMVQIPDIFKRCIVTATASGSRGVYGAIGASGEWGLKRGCAVAYTDKGTGNGLHDLMTNVVGLIDGIRTIGAGLPLTADLAGSASHFTAALTDAERAAYNVAFPNRVAYKHAHSQQNPEADWGKNTLQAVVFAFYVLNEQLGTPHGNSSFKRIAFDRRNTLVIASAISNGGTGGLAAAEQDRFGLIDGVAVTEPNAQPEELHGLRIEQGGNKVDTIGKPLYDYFTYGNLYQPCAALAVGAAAPAFAFLGIPNPAGAANRCAGLKAKGLLAGATEAEQAAEALDKLHKYGWGTEADVLHASHYRFATNAIAVTYSNTYGRFSVADNVCGFSFANTDAAGNVISQEVPLPPLLPTQPLPQPTIFATGNGVPPTTRVNIVYNDSVGGAKLDLLAVSPSTNLPDFALDGAICHRNLVEGRDIVSGAPLTGAQKDASDRVREGIEDVLLEAELGGKPAIIVAGRSDALVPPNHASRAYFGATQLEGRGHGRRHGHGDKGERGENRNVRYVEVTNAQHFDAFLPGGAVFGGYEKRFVPLHVYLIRSLDWMYDHLKSGKQLPPSQVVRGVPRCADPTCATAPAITDANVPPIEANPDPGNLITMSGRTLHIPE
ncbi:MAG TPA: 3-hydroxybutyrate oligomer hydrolase family protein [Burkholderiales bacterium]|nr:3-hydroxybutyrate oligomer hydrolase family protein [Burkholderiales bacterium]